MFGKLEDCCIASSLQNTVDTHSPMFVFITATGGTVILQGGEGRHTSVHDGNDGGSVVLRGGKSYGNGFHDDVGSVNIAAGASSQGDGGYIVVASGSSESKSSELDLVLNNANQSLVH